MIKLINNLKNKKGFTLIELIVVLAVLGAISAIAVPRFLGVQDKAKEDADKATIEMIEKAAELYYVAEENPSETPSLDDLDDYINSSDVKWQIATGTLSINIDPTTGEAEATGLVFP